MAYFIFIMGCGYVNIVLNTCNAIDITFLIKFFIHVIKLRSCPGVIENESKTNFQKSSNRLLQ